MKNEDKYVLLMGLLLFYLALFRILLLIIFLQQWIRVIHKGLRDWLCFKDYYTLDFDLF